MKTKIISLLKIWRPLVIYILIWLIAGTILMLFNYEPSKNWFVNFISSWDVASSVALSILAFIAYYRYSNEQNKQLKFIKDLEKAKEASEFYSEGAIIVQMGGGNKYAIDDARLFLSQKFKIPDALIIAMQFGDKDNNISIEDMSELNAWLQNDCMRLLAHVDKVHIIISGMGIAYAVVTDTLNNWKTLCFYHKNNSGYELWYVDKKSLPKNNASDPLRNTQ